MSAASFISLAGIVAFAGNGYAGSVYLMGWTGGYVLLALLLAPYLRKFGKYTIPDFVGDRYNETARLVAVVAAIVVSFTYVAGQMAGVGLVFTRFLDVNPTTGVVIGMAIVFFYAVLGGMKGITWTQVAQYTVLIIAYLIPAVAVSAKVTGVPLPQIGFGRILDELNGLQQDLGFAAVHRGVHPDLADEHGAHHRGADVRHRRPAARHRPLLHGQVGARGAVLGAVGAVLHLAALHDRPVGGGVLEAPDHPGRLGQGAHRRPELVPDVGERRADHRRRPQQQRPRSTTSAPRRPTS